MKKSGIFLFVMLIVTLAIGCSNETSTAPAGGSDEKMVIVKGINATNEPWVFDRKLYGSMEYRGELDGIYAKDFTVGPGEAFYTDNSNASDYKDYDSFAETSSTTYEIKIQFVAGGPAPKDKNEQYVYAPFAAVVDFVIKGTYGKPVTIEWDGSAFKQLD